MSRYLAKGGIFFVSFLFPGLVFSQTLEKYCKAIIETEQDFLSLASPVDCRQVGLGLEGDCMTIGVLVPRQEDQGKVDTLFFWFPTPGGLGLRVHGFGLRTCLGMGGRLQDFWPGFILRVPSDPNKFLLLPDAADLDLFGRDTIRATIIYMWKTLQPLFNAGELFFAPVTPIESQIVREGLPIPTYQEDTFENFIIYGPGTTIGYLRYLNEDKWTEAREEGWISRSDILLLDFLPFDFDIPVAGVITTQPQGILSHINVLCLGEGVPNLYISNALEQLQEFIDKPVKLSAFGGDWWIESVDSSLVYKNLLQRKPRPLKVNEPDDSFKGLPSLTELAGSFPVERCGGKAAYLAYFLPAIPEENRIPGFVIPFGFFTDFMESNRLGDLTFFELARTNMTRDRFLNDSKFRRDILSEMRRIFRDESWVPRLTIERIAKRIEEVFGSKEVLVRFRSSSNAEDSALFPGAGLYDSTSACALDSLDGNKVGPCLCNESIAEERTIGRALRKVWVSLWKDRAVEERLWYGLPEDKIRMGILVTPAFTDEAANGVAFTSDPQKPSDYFYITAQFGDVSVVRPPPGSLPEVDNVWRNQEGHWQIARISLSSLSSEERKYVLSDGQLLQLANILERLRSYWEMPLSEVPKALWALDVEFKLTKEGVIKIKQVRPYLIPGASFFANRPKVALSFKNQRFWAFPINVRDPFEAQEKTLEIFLPKRLLQVPCFPAKESKFWIKEIVTPEGAYEPSEPGLVQSEVEIDSNSWFKRDFRLRVHLLQRARKGESSLSVRAEYETTLNQREISLKPSFIEVSLYQISVSKGGESWSCLLVDQNLGRYPLRRITFELENEARIVLYERKAPPSLLLSLPVRAELKLDSEHEVVEGMLRLTATKGVSPQRKAYLIKRAENKGFVLVAFYLGRSDPRCFVLDNEGNTLKEYAVLSWKQEIVQSPGSVAFKRGDVDLDGVLSLNDALRLLNYLFNEKGQLPCPDAADFDDNGILNVSDAIAILKTTFGGPVFETCSPDETEDGLGPCTYGPWLCGSAEN